MTSHSSDKIEVHCPACGKVYRLAPSAAGKSAKCGCGNRFVVETVTPDTLAPSAEKPKLDLGAALDQLERESQVPGCMNHPDDQGKHTCAKCGSRFCSRCVRKTKSGKRICLTCVPRQATPPAEAPSVASPPPATDAGGVPATMLLTPIAETPTLTPLDPSVGREGALEALPLTPIADAPSLTPLDPSEGDDDVMDAIPVDASDPAEDFMAAPALGTLQPVADMNAFQSGLNTPSTAPALTPVPLGNPPLQPIQPQAGQLQPLQSPMQPQHPTLQPVQPTPATANPYGAPQTQSVEGGHAGYVGAGCKQHPQSMVAGQCSICRAAICRTCLFVFPPNLTCCPECATKTDIPLSMHRKIMIYASLGCAAFGSLSLALLCSGVLGFLDVLPLLVSGPLIYALMTLPSCVGLGMACGSYNKTEGNPPLLWAGAIWSGLTILGPILFFGFSLITSFALG